MKNFLLALAIIPMTEKILTLTQWLSNTDKVTLIRTEITTGKKLYVVRDSLPGERIHAYELEAIEAALPEIERGCEE